MTRAALFILGCAACLAVLARFNPKLELARFPDDSCHAFTAWMQRNEREKSLEERLTEGMDVQDKEFVRSVGHDVLHWISWGRHATPFAAFSSHHTLQQILSSPALQTGAHLLIVPGSGRPQRRLPSQPFVSAAPGVNASVLESVFPLSTLSATAPIIETAILRGRHLHAFTIETAQLPMCGTAAGACALWEASSGKVVIDSGLIERLSHTPGISQLTNAFARIFPLRLVELTEREGLQTVKLGSAGALAEVIGKAAVAAVAGALLAELPLWWCFACPIALGMLAPLAFNFGLTAAAEQVCGVLQLSAEECSDLWWAAFALAMVLSLAAAVPIVYACRLPDCIKRGVHVGGNRLQDAL